MKPASLSISPSCRTTCPYCGVGCGIDAARNRDSTVTVKGVATHPANLGRLCVKGTNLPDTLDTSHRLLQPRIKQAAADWDSALDLVARRFAQTIAKHGPGSVAFYLSGQLLTEDYYVANKLMKGFLGSSNVDTNSRLCMASAVASYRRAFGVDAVPCNYEDLELCDLLVITGSNAAWTHPVLLQRVMAARDKRPQLKIVVIDPRRTATSELADLHLPLNPGSDSFLFNGLLHYLAASGLTDSNYIAMHTEGFDAAIAAAGDCTLANAAHATGISQPDLGAFYNWFAGSRRVITFYSQGVNQSATGTDKCNAIINCHLAGGQLGRPGCGPFSITGQPNAMGGREVGGLANQLAAHMEFTGEDIDRVRRFWQAPRMATNPGLKAVDLFQAMADGQIKAIWIMATNPAVSLPDSARVREGLERCEFVVVSDCTARTDTTALADVLLPATTWGEKNGTVTNSERCISRQRPFLPPTGDSRHDWQIICDVARRLGFHRAFDYASPWEIFREHAALSAFENGGSRLFNLGALARIEKTDYDALEPVQWPVREDGRGTARLFTEGRFNTPSGKARLVPVQAQLPGRVDTRRPFILISGRLRDQWHTMTRTGQSGKLMRHTDSPRLYLCARDYQALNLDDSCLVSVAGTTGNMLLIPEIVPGLSPGQVFAPIHWSDQYSSSAVVSRVYPALTDAVSGQPQSKWTTVTLRRQPVAAWAIVVCREPPELDGAAYWHKINLGSAMAWCLALQDTKAPLAQLQHQYRRRFPRAETASFSDSKISAQRRLWFDEGRLAAAVFIAPRRPMLPERDWLATLPGTAHGDASWLLLAGQDYHASDRGRLICSCFEVGEKAIRKAVSAGADTPQALGEQLKCGTNCGSCLPELKQLIDSVQTNSTRVLNATRSRL